MRRNRIDAAVTGDKNIGDSNGGGWQGCETGARLGPRHGPLDRNGGAYGDGGRAGGARRGPAGAAGRQRAQCAPGAPPRAGRASGRAQDFRHSGAVPGRGAERVRAAGGAAGDRGCGDHERRAVAAGVGQLHGERGAGAAPARHRRDLALRRRPHGRVAEGRGESGRSHPRSGPGGREGRERLGPRRRLCREPQRDRDQDRHADPTSRSRSRSCPSR